MTETIKPLSKRKEARKQIFSKLSDALAEYKAGIKEKRFDASLKKASKLLASQLVRRNKKKKEKAPKGSKKKIKAVPAEIPVK